MTGRTKTTQRGDPSANGRSDDERVPPNNIDAEEALVGCGLLSPIARETGLGTVTADDFYKPALAHIAHAIARLVDRGSGVDVVTVGEELRRTGLLEEVGGQPYLNALQLATPAISMASQYAMTVRDTAIRRRLIAVGAQVAEIGYDEAADTSTALSKARVALDGLDGTTGLKSMRSRLLSVADLADLPNLEYVVDQLLDFDSVVLAYGRRDSGKSFVAIDLVNAVASGSRWHGRRVTHAPAIYVVAEGAAGLHQRFDAWQHLDRNLGTALPADQLMILPEAVNLLSSSAVEEFAAMAANVGARLIVFDTLARCMVGGDENSAKDAGLAIEQLDAIRRRTGACIIIIHHSGKSLEAGARGSSAFEAAADTVLEIAMTDDVVTVTCTKQKNHVTPNPIRLRLHSTGPSAVLDEYRTDGNELPRGVVETLAALRDIEVTGGVSASAWRLSSGKTEPTFYRHRKDLVTLGLVSSLGTDKQPRYQVSDSGTIALSKDSHDSQ